MIPPDWSTAELTKAASFHVKAAGCGGLVALTGTPACFRLRIAFSSVGERVAIRVGVSVEPGSQSRNGI